ncbi:glycosidase, partial [Klebsiella pneumoniae]
RPGMWDGTKIGIAGTPIRIPEGWLFIYHAVGPDFAYRIGAALIDAETGTRVIARTALPILSPVLPWEKSGQVSNVLFSCGAILRG